MSKNLSKPQGAKYIPTSQELGTGNQKVGTSQRETLFLGLCLSWVLCGFKAELGSSPN